jgi:hypothetical protein
VQPFRRHRRLFLLALILFLAQTVLSLAHVHAPAGARHTGGSACAQANEPCKLPDPTGHGEHCALCAAISTTSTLDLPPPIALLRLIRRCSSAPMPCRSLSLVGKPSTHFQPRAPPTYCQA